MGCAHLDMMNSGLEHHPSFEAGPQSRYVTSDFSKAADVPAAFAVPEWRFGSGWSVTELEHHLSRLRDRKTNFSESWHRMTVERNWNRYSSEAVLAQELSGPPLPDGFFQRARIGLENYKFSDPEIVVAHFDPRTPLLGRLILLEIKIWRLHYLNGVVVSEVRSDDEGGVTTFGFQYDTLEGHLERGSEWFLLQKDHASGIIRYRIEAAYRPGAFPNWWSRMGFKLFASRFQRRWHYEAGRRLRLLGLHGELTSSAPDHGRLVHEGPEVIFERRRRRRS